jgi:hypothetical protein
MSKVQSPYGKQLLQLSVRARSKKRLMVVICPRIIRDNFNEVLIGAKYLINSSALHPHFTMMRVDLASWQATLCSCALMTILSRFQITSKRRVTKYIGVKAAEFHTEILRSVLEGYAESPAIFEDLEKVLQQIIAGIKLSTAKILHHKVFGSCLPTLICHQPIQLRGLVSLFPSHNC